MVLLYILTKPSLRQRKFILAKKKNGDCRGAKEEVLI